jgi:hypothetical protein
MLFTEIMAVYSENQVKHEVSRVDKVKWKVSAAGACGRHIYMHISSAGVH